MGCASEASTAVPSSNMMKFVYHLARLRIMTFMLVVAINF